jgi:hypothetical protein
MKQRSVGVLLVLVAACSSSSGQSGGASGSDSSLAGAWDVVGTRLGDSPVSGKLIVDAERLTLVFGSSSFAALRDGDKFALVAGFGSTAIASTARNKTGPSANLGAVPLNVSGSWYIIDRSDSSTNLCAWSLGVDSAQGDCLDVGTLPSWVGSPANASASAERKLAAPSIFGDLGGEWQVLLSTGGTCTAKFEGSKVSGACSGAGKFNGSFQLEFSGGIASGSTDRGLELSAKRH